MSLVALSRILLVLFAAGAIVTPAFAQDRTWDVNADGAWNDSANWDTADVPDTPGENAIITSPDGTTAVTATLAFNVTRELGDLTIVDNGPNPAHTVVVPNNTFFDIHGDIENNGVIELNSLGNFTRLRLDGSDLSLTGTGVINLGAGNTAISNATGTNTLTNASTHTIAGGGFVGANNININNAGTIDANLSGVTMSIDPDPVSGLVNTGTIRGSSAGIASLSGNGGGDFDNTSGVIEAVGTGSEVQLTVGASVTGGTVRSSGGGVVRVMPSQNVFFTDVTFDGEVRGENNSDFGVSGTITNNAGITIDSLGNGTDIELQADTTFAGNGTVTLQGSVARINGIGAAVLTNGASHTIQGTGFLGNNSANLINNGVINANAASQTLTIDPDSISGLDNNGTARATNGGFLSLTGSGGGDFDNTSGVIEAVGAGSEVQLTTSAVVSGGTVGSSSGGVVRVMPSQDVFFTDVTFEGAIRGENNSDFGVSGTITNNAGITLDSLGNATDIEVQTSGADLAGTGTIALQGPTARIRGIGGAVLTNGSSHTIEGAGNVGNNSTNLVNNGLINANVAGQTLTIDPDSISGLDNNATVRASGGGIVSLTGSGNGDFDNAGGVIEAIGVDSEVQLTVGASVTGGMVGSSGGGVVRVMPSQNVFFTDVTFEGEFRGENNSDFGVSGTITNNADITIDSQGNGTDLEVQAGGATLAGTGTLTLQGPVARINAISQAELTNGPSHTIDGTGSIDTPIVNNGSIVGDSATDFIEINQRVSGSGSLENVRIDNVHAPGDDVATVDLSGDYTIAASGQLHIDIGGVTAGTEYDQLSSTGDVTLDGDLVVSPIDLGNGYTPAAGDEFTIITSTTPLNGTFDTENLPLQYNERVLLWDPVDYSNPNEVSLRIDVSVLGGDANDDGVVDLLDLDILGANFGTNGPGGPSIGDFDFSGQVNLLDLDILGTNFGFGTSTAIPEPSALLLCSFALIAVTRRQA